MNTLPFNKPGKFWRGNLHTHSTQSDGKLSPQEVCQVYHEAGYHFLAITDHFMEHYGYPMTNTIPFRTEQFTTLIGAELHVGKTELGHLWHILAVGLPFDFAPPPEKETGPEITARAAAGGAFVAIAHPNWYGLTEGDVISLKAADAIEVFNGTSLDHNDRADSWYMLDLMLMRGERFLACATDDAHFYDTRNDAILGWVWVKSEQLTPESIVTALKAGHYYSSTGPQIHDIQFEGQGEERKILIRCSPAEYIFVTGYGYESARVAGRGMLGAELSLKTITSPYCRVTVRDAKGGRAWSNPIWFG